MLYLEDYLESKFLILLLCYLQTNPSFSVIEHLPQELRDRFTDIREMDLTVHSKFKS